MIRSVHIYINHHMKNAALQHNLDEKDLRYHNNANSYLFPHPPAYPVSHQCEHSRIFSSFRLHVTKHDDHDYEDHDDYDVMLPWLWRPWWLWCYVSAITLKLCVLKSYDGQKLYFLSCSYMNFPRVSREVFINLHSQSLSSDKLWKTRQGYRSLWLHSSIPNPFKKHNIIHRCISVWNFETLLQM